MPPPLWAARIHPCKRAPNRHGTLTPLSLLASDLGPDLLGTGISSGCGALPKRWPPAAKTCISSRRCPVARTDAEGRAHRPAAPGQVATPASAPARCRGPPDRDDFRRTRVERCCRVRRGRARSRAVRTFPFGRRSCASSSSRARAHRGMRPRPRVVRVDSRHPATGGKARARRGSVGAAHAVSTSAVHGDPTSLRFEETFPALPPPARTIVYTGYVTARRSVPRAPLGEQREIVVSAGRVDGTMCFCRHRRARRFRHRDPLGASGRSRNRRDESRAFAAKALPASSSSAIATTFPIAGGRASRCRRPATTR